MKWLPFEMEEILYYMFGGFFFFFLKKKSFMMFYIKVKIVFVFFMSILCSLLIYTPTFYLPILLVLIMTIISLKKK
jgi:hypothetical protein